jgi:hypothetical protein
VPQVDLIGDRGELVDHDLGAGFGDHPRDGVGSEGVGDHRADPGGREGLGLPRCPGQPDHFMT